MSSSSPESSKPISSSTSLTLSNTFQTQGSPVFSYISNLSPIKPDKIAPVAHGFLGINSPPFVFRSTQINPQKQKDYKTRARFTRLSDAGSSEQDENVEDTDIVAEKSGISSGLSRDLTNSPQKTLVTDNSPQTNPSSFPGNSDDYLSTIVNMDGRAFATSANLSPKSSDCISQSQNDLLDSKESVEKTEIKGGTTNEKLKIGAPPLILEQAEENDLRNSLSDLKSFVLVKKLQDSVMPQNICPKVDRDSCKNHAVDDQHREHSEAENTRFGHLFQVGFSSQLECEQIAQDSGVCENAVQFTASIGEKMHGRAPKVGQHQHGISRRLQFEDAHSKKLADVGFQVPSGSAGYPRLPFRSADREVLQSAPVNKPVSPSNMLLASNMTQTVFYPQNNENYDSKVTKPSGIGLHLNSIVAKQEDSATNASGTSEGGSFEGIENKSLAIMSSQLHKDCSISSNTVRGASWSGNDDMYDSRTSIGAGSSKSSYNMKPLFEPVVLGPKMELQSNSSNKMNFNPETFDSITDIRHSNPEKKRKKDTCDSNGCKRCNCKKTKCLKLYCDCFAAGIYCAEPCACQGCFNRPEYEDTVLETRGAIESRNPSAFTSKITQHISEPPINVSVDDGDFTPSSGKHKRGCNCKKSKCLKKYCECYQANVGCSDDCRCEGCDNVYGRKEEYGTIKDMVRKHGNNKKLDSSFEIMLSKDALLHNELYSSHNLTPLTPPFKYSINGKGASRAWFSSGRCLQSPESDLNLLTPFELSQMSAENPDNRDMLLETNTEIMDPVTFPQGFGFGNGHTANKFSPCGPSNVDHLTSAALSYPLDWAATSSRTQIFPGNRHVSSESSLRWRRSPVAPSTHVRESKFYDAAEFTNRPCSMIVDDDIPEILKEDTVSTNAVIVNSPNKKRVSPPHGQQSELGSCASAGLKSHKFILRGVQTISPKTPRIESQGDSGPYTDNSQSSSSSK